MCRLFLTSFLFAVALKVFAAQPITSSFATCVGSRFTPLLKETPNTAETRRPLCLSQNGISVCRAMLDENRDDNGTMEISLTVEGKTVQKWVENSDPVYFLSFHAFVETGHGDTRIVIAAQQSETQGMGVQEWLIHAIRLSQKHIRRTFTTSDFGTNGALIAPQSKPCQCKLLLTRWESRKTRSGESLYLTGRLVDLDTDAPVESYAPIFRRKLDRRFKTFRESQPADSPISYFYDDKNIK